MQCDYFDTHRCRSCTLMGTGYADQLADKQARCAQTLGQITADLTWAAPFASAPERFRNKAKLVVGGTREDPTVGILDRDRQGVDLRHCGLYEAGLGHAVTQVPDLISEIGLVPYDVPRRSGELKHVLLTHSPTGALMVRFVLRSTGQQGRILRSLDLLHERLPGLAVVSVNLQPEHAAILEGDEETVLTPGTTLEMPVNEVDLLLRPRGFFQTNTAVAAGLYRQARQWIDEVDPGSLWDLYCGVGGFALHARTRPDGTARQVLGVEVSPEAVESARASARRLVADREAETGDGPGCAFEVGDATELLRDRPAPDLVVVNPPRRGIGAPLAGWLESSGVSHVLYSSCAVASLVRDLRAMPTLRPVRARLFDMFPQTPHSEVLVLLERATAPGTAAPAPGPTP